METPSSSTRRVTRSQTMAALNNSIPISRRIEDCEKSASKSRQRATMQQQDRSALIDITNDSPIVGLAKGGLETPSSAVSKQRTIRDKIKTPGSGETLLRCQVKTLLQKVEEGAELSKISLPTRGFLNILQDCVNSPMPLLAPTPANTPQILNVSEDGSVSNSGLHSTNAFPVNPEQMIPQAVSDIIDGKVEESIESDINMISRSLLLDFSEKTESTECSSVVIDEGESEGKEKSYSDEDDDDDERVVAYEEENEAGVFDGGLLDELCEEMSRISVNNNNKQQAMAEFTGTHTRFLYNSDDEIVEEPTGGVSPKVLCFKGLPTPKGKHIRFAIEEEEEEEEEDI